MKFVRRFNLTVTEDSDMPRDGNCWFHAVSWYFKEGRNRMNAQRHRQAVCKFIMDNKDEFLPFCVDKDTNPLSDAKFVRAVNNLRKMGTYNTSSSIGDVVGLAISRLYNFEIVMFDPLINSEPFSIGRNDESPKLQVARLTVGNTSHIQGLVPIK